MPELPEVETVRRGLETKLINKKIIDVTIKHNNIIAYPTVNEFKNKIINQTINKIDRYGKWLMFILDDYCLFSHLRMEGKYFFKDKNEELNKHEHVIFTLDNNTHLRYMDVRKFGKMYLINKNEMYEKGPLVGLGLDPWDKKLTENYLKDKYKNKRLPIKTVILDQSIIVGIGNIYADEILYTSGINPLKKCSTLDDLELKKIIKNTKEILKNAIDKGGSTIHSYSSVNGVHGRFQQELKVHLREGEKCYKCGNKIIKTKVGGRGTYYCKNCQQ